MATALTKPQSKIDAQLTQELSNAAQRIRLADALSGGLSLAVLALAYTLIAILLDRWLELPGAIRFTGLAIFLGLFLTVAYSLLMRPLRRAINPRFAARKVEQTIPDAKNAIINWVDLKEEDLSDAVRLAVGARAVEGVSDGDVNRVAESRGIVWLAVAAGLLFAGLAVVFLLFKPSPFFSLLNRTYNPFTSSGIATRTEITLLEPAGGDVIVTAGEPLVVLVTVRGTIPDPNGLDRVRLMIRYNAEAADTDEVPLETAGSTREYATKLPQSIIQNGFWYHVAAGDARTAEHKVTVRSKPMVKDFDVKYEYPEYTRIKPETAREPRIEAYRGTRITLNVKTNRTLREGWLQLDTQAVKIPATVVGEAADTLQFQFPLDESGAYRIGFIAATDEVSEPTSPYPIRVLMDQKPQVTITKPVEEEVTQPLNSLLKIDGLISDDFGVQSVSLNLRVIGEKPTTFQPQKYRDGKPLRREVDGSFPTTVEYKDSVKLGTFQTDKAEAFTLQPGMLVEYWLEATDNCMVPRANVGKSKVQRVKIAVPEVQPVKQEQQKRDQDKRKDEEKQHQDKQVEQFNNEKRDPQQPRGDEQTQQEKPNPDQTKPDGTKPPEGSGTNEPMPPTTDGTKPNEPMPNPMGENPPKQDGTKQSNDKTPGKQEPKNDSNDAKPNDELQEKADKVNEALKQEERQPGGGRGQNNDDTKQQESPSTPKSDKPQPSEMNPAEPKEGQKSSEPKKSDPSESKNAGKVEEQPPSQQKPEPAKSNNPNDKPEDGTGKTQKTEPRDQQPNNKPGQEKSSPEKQSGDSNPMKESDSAADRKPAPQDGTNKPEKNAGEPKQKPESSRGNERSAPKESGTEDAGKPDRERPADGKPKQPPAPASSKKQPDPNAKPMASDESKPAPEAGTDKPENKPSTTKPEGTQPNNPMNTKPEKGNEKPQPSANTEGDKPLDRKGLEDAVKDLKSGDPEKQKAARDKLDKAMGKENREAAEKKADQLEKDLKSGDPAKQEAAKKELENFAKQIKEQQKQNGDKTPMNGSDDKPLDRKELEEAIKDLKSGDPDKQKAAREKLDKALGKENREAAEKKADQLEKDLKSGDPAKQEAAKKELENLANQAKEHQQKQNGEQQKPSAEDIEKWKKKAEDLNSKDDAKRQAAEKDFDEAVGPEERKQYQKDMNDAKSDNPEKAAEAKKRLEENANKNAEQDGKRDKYNPKPGERDTGPNRPHEDDPKNRLKSAELQLQQLEKARYNKALQEKLGYTPEQYEEFLKSYGEAVNRQRTDVGKQELQPNPTKPATGPATLKVGEGSGNKKAETRTDGTTGTVGGVGPGTAAPGYAEAQRKFAEEAAKLKKSEPKKP